MGVQGRLDKIGNVHIHKNVKVAPSDDKMRETSSRRSGHMQKHALTFLLVVVAVDDVFFPLAPRCSLNLK